MTSSSGPYDPQVAQQRPLLAEHLLLLAFDPDNGRLRVSPSSPLSLGLAGAVLTELTLCDGVAIEERRGAAGGRRVLARPARTGDPLLDEVAGKVQAQRPRTLTWWIKRSRAGLQRRLLDRLSADGLAATSRGPFRRRVRLVSPAVRAEPAARVRKALLADPAVAARLWSTDPWSASLTSLSFACRVIRGFAWLPRQERRGARANLEVIRGTDPIGQTVAAITKSADTAAMIAAQSTIAASTFGRMGSG